VSIVSEIRRNREELIHSSSRHIPCSSSRRNSVPIISRHFSEMARRKDLQSSSSIFTISFNDNDRRPWRWRVCYVIVIPCSFSGHYVNYVALRVYVVVGQSVLVIGVGEW